jgi:hypothetical protein
MPQEVAQHHHGRQAAPCQSFDPVQDQDELLRQWQLGLPTAVVAEWPFRRELQAVIGVGRGDDPVVMPVLPLGAREGTNVGAGRPLPELQVVGTNLALAPP